METVPIPDATPEQREALTAAVQAILTAKDADPNANVTDWEAEIDRMVFDLYGLGEDERAVVRGARVHATML